MHILVDLGEEKLRVLDELSKSAKRSRAALIREAVDDYLAKRYATIKGDAFGLWLLKRKGRIPKDIDLGI